MNAMTENSVMSKSDARILETNGHRVLSRQTASAPVSPRVHTRDFHDQSTTPKLHRAHHVQHGQRSSGTPDRQPLRRTFQPDASIVLVGIRGCGKRSLGFIAATALGRRFITEDHYFQAVTGLSRQDFLKLHGSEEFHKQDIEMSRQMLEDNRSGCVIDCGLGSLTSGLQEYLRSYSATNPVIYILRDMAHVKRLLKLSDRSAKLLESGDPTHRRCSNYEYYNLEDHTADVETDNTGLDRGLPTYSFKLKETQADFSYFVRTLTGAFSKSSNITSPYSLDVPVDSRLFTYALELPFSVYEEDKIDLSKLQAGGDVVEICVDRWQNSAPKTLSRMVADVRRHIKVPVLLSVAWRSIGLTIDTYLNVLKHCFRLAVEFLSIDLDLGQHHIAELLALKGPTRCIANAVLTKDASNLSVWLSGTAMAALNQASALRFDLVRLMHAATSREENDKVYSFVQTLKQQSFQGPSIIAYNTGRLGRTSQVSNQILTPVTHTLLRTRTENRPLAATPQITAQQSMKASFSNFVLDPLRFSIIGGNVSNSLSPAMHGAAYRLLGLQHNYTTVNIKSWDDVDSLAKDPNFGGASVVQPWKVKLASKVAHLSEHARIIGAINTLIPLRSNPDGSVPPLRVQAAQRNRAGPVAAWYADNTDWIAMFACIGRSLSPRNVVQPKSTGLVVGAGGMARSATYALIQLGCRNIFVYNRTIRNAETLATHYNQWLSSRDDPNRASASQVRVIRSMDEPWPSGFVQPTMVVSCVTHEHLEGNPDANFTMPEGWLKSDSGGVVLELAYITRETPLTMQIKQYQHATGKPWVVVDGIEALLEQGFAQFEIMTGRPAPKDCMRDAVRRAIQEKQTFVAETEEAEIS